MEKEYIWNEYTFKKLTEAEYPAWASFFSLVFKKRFSSDFFRIKYNTDHLGKKLLACIAYDSHNVPVASFTNIPYRMDYEGKKYITLQNCDDATHPNHQRKGLSSKISQFSFQLAKQENYTWLFGLPNQTLSLVFDKQGWVLLERFKLYILKIKTIPLFGIMHRLGLSNVYEKYTRFILKAYIVEPKPFNSFSNMGYITVERSLEHLSYKAGLGNFFVKINEVIFWIKIIGGSLVIGDIKVDTEAELLKALKELKRLGKILGLKSIIFQTQSGSDLQQHFQNNFSSKNGLPVYYMDLGSELPLGKLKLTFADFDTF